MDAGEDLLHAAGERVLALVEPVDVGALTREFTLALVVRHVAPDRHPVADVLGEQVEPVLIPALVEQLGFPVEELLDLALYEQPIDVPHASSFQLAASMNCRQRR